MIFSPANSGGGLHLRARQSVSRWLISTVATLLQTLSFRTWWGHAETELQEFSFLDITYEEDREAKLKLVRELAEGRRQHFQIETRYRRKDGTLLWVRNNISLVPGSDVRLRTMRANNSIEKHSEHWSTSSP